MTQSSWMPARGIDVSTGSNKTVAVALDWGRHGVAIGDIRPHEGQTEIVKLAQIWRTETKI